MQQYWFESPLNFFHSSFIVSRAMGDKTIESVVKDGLCTSCGTCMGVCPNDAIEMVIDNSKGVYFPQLYRERCNECGICLDVCPGHAVDFKQLNLKIFGKEPEDTLLGNYLNCYIGHAVEHNIRYNSASGGLATALLIFALEEGIINGALVSRANRDKPLEPQPFIARTREDLLSAARSKYCPLPANMALKQIIAEEGKFAVVGLPCQIQGIRKAEEINKRLKDRIALHLGLFCGAPMTFDGTYFILQKYKILKESITRLDYRGQGWPGCMTIQLKDGTKRLIPLSEYIIYHDLGFFTPLRCVLCCEQINELADISLGDAWLPELEWDTIGTSAVICRNQVGNNFLSLAIGKEKIALRYIDENKVRKMESKKVSYPIKSRLSSLCGNKQPSYNILLPKAGSTPLFLLLYTSLFTFLLYPNLFLSSRKKLRWLIKPISVIEQILTKLGHEIVRLARIR